MTALAAIRAGAHLSGREFDRVAAAYVLQSGRKGPRFTLVKTLIRGGRLAFFGWRDRSASTVDPLSEPGAHCFLSKLGMHKVVGRRTNAIAASVTALLHDTIPVDQPEYFEPAHTEKFKRDLDWMFAHCRQVVCVSESTARRGRAYADASPAGSPAAIQVNPLGSFLREGIGERGAEPLEALVGQSFAVYCSTIEIRKNHIMLLRVWQKLMPLLGDRLPKLVLCGRWGWMVDEVRQFLVDHPEIGRKVVFLTGISDAQLAWLYGNARFGVFPSHVEGWGLGAAECLDFGLPVLISDAEALAEATQSLMPVIPAGDFDGWCAAVERAATDDAWLALLRAKIAATYRPTSEVAFAARLLTLMQASSGAPAASLASIPVAVDEHGAGPTEPTPQLRDG
ncbi:MAG: hypothetical protein ABS35_27785 [Kaistia sp. SCN 65-12]|nr:MAG: hypothetical protein ABS35_27785 [Kaistia sp. SCN 65-12]